MMDFDAFVTNNWPAGVPADCTLIRNEDGDVPANVKDKDSDNDCIERDLPEKDYCLSCKTYAGLVDSFYAKEENKQ